MKSGNKDRMLDWFKYAHLPDTLREASPPFGELAEMICDSIEPGPERTVALRKLLEAKDAAVRAKLKPGGGDREISTSTGAMRLPKTRCAEPGCKRLVASLRCD
ncbi:hypothetical protein [Roseiconus lacunae]|uniref:hypothetical protein n=1 Tax=Roseiconus lacunae TaxID=2605694 RepID=UPI00190F08AA|nr:hypothetical protein [Roseiconus lacunae]